MKKYVVITVINREISTQFTNDINQAQKLMKNTYNDYLNDEESLDQNNYGYDDFECWISGIYNNVDIAIHEIL